LTEDIALVTTADFITPPVNDPFLFGQIAAANAISDVYAMGGRPITCLNLAAFPSKKLDPSVLHGIVTGALSKITEAGAVLAGGHSIEDDEPKFGLAVTGIVHPEKYWANSGARQGDALILTKPIGSGVLLNANLKGWVPSGAFDECLSVLTTLNKRAAEVFSGFEVHAATDVTGFGLAGHGYEMAKASQVTFHLTTEWLPVMKQASEMYQRGVTTGMNESNRRLVEHSLRFTKNLPAFFREIVFDPQTNGGLLVAVPKFQAEKLLSELHSAGIIHARQIGRVIPVENDTHLIFD